MHDKIKIYSERSLMAVIKGLSSNQCEVELDHPEVTDEDWEKIGKRATSLLLAITSKCNSHCRLCFMKNCNYDEMSIEYISDILTKAGRGKKIILWGGEPTTRDDLPEIIKLVKRSGNIPIIYTNGLKLSDFDYTKALKKAGLQAVIFSFDGFREKIYEVLRSDPNHLELKAKTLENLRKIGIQTYISMTVLNDLNDDQILPMLHFCIMNNDFIKSLSIYTAVNLGRNELGDFKILTPNKIMRRIENGEPTVRREYFFQLKRLIYLMNSTFSKFKINTSKRRVMPDGLYLVENNDLVEAIKLEDLITINNLIENKRHLKLFGYMFKYRELAWLYLKSRFKPARFEIELGKRNYFNIYVSFPTDDHSTERDCVSLCKKDNFTRMAANPA